MGFELIPVGQSASRGGRAHGEGLAVPVQRALRGQDRPVHSSKSIDEEARRGLDDEMVGLEPGDPALGPFVLHAAKTDEGVHLVQIAPDILGQALETVDQRIGGDLQQILLPTPDAPDQAIKQGVALGIAVAGDGPCQFGRPLRQHERRGRFADLPLEQARLRS